MRVPKNDPEIKMLIVEDIEPRFIVDKMREEIQKSFPLANIDIADNFKHAETLIKTNRYEVIFLDANLSGWTKHPVFKQYGGNMIPFIKEVSPKSIIVSSSSDKGYSEEMIELGADIILSKMDFKKPISEELTLE